MRLERKQKNDEDNFEDESKHKQHIDDDYDDRWWCILACLPRSCSNFPQCSLHTTSHTEQRVERAKDQWCSRSLNFISHCDRTSWVLKGHKIGFPHLGVMKSFMMTWKCQLIKYESCLSYQWSPVHLYDIGCSWCWTPVHLNDISCSYLRSHVHANSPYCSCLWS